MAPHNFRKGDTVAYRLRDGSSWHGTLIRIDENAAQTTAFIKNPADGFVRVPIQRVTRLEEAAE